jgi:nicotinate-nucleotide adenylyltransferase
VLGLTALADDGILAELMLGKRKLDEATAEDPQRPVAAHRHLGSTPLMMAYWFAPLLAGWGRISAQGDVLQLRRLLAQLAGLPGLRARADARGDGAQPADRRARPRLAPARPAAQHRLPAVFIPVVFASFYANALDVFGTITPMTLPEAGPLGVFGGTFDPIHYGHLRLAETAREALGLARVRLIPAGQPPHRATPGAAAPTGWRWPASPPPTTRPSRSTRPKSRPPRPASPSSASNACAPNSAPAALVLLLGVDAFLGLPTWRRWTELFDFAHLAVANRPGYSLDGAAMPAALAEQAAARPLPTPWAQPRRAPGAVCDDAAGHLRHRHPRPAPPARACAICSPAGC